MSKERPPHLLRDYGLTLALVLASVLLFWKTLVPQIHRNQVLDRAYLEMRDRNRSAESEVERLKLLDQAVTDPLIMERKSREYFGDLFLPAHEVQLDEGLADE